MINGNNFNFTFKHKPGKISEGYINITELILVRVLNVLTRKHKDSHEQSPDDFYEINITGQYEYSPYGDRDIKNLRCTLPMNQVELGDITEDISPEYEKLIFFYVANKFHENYKSENK